MVASYVQAHADQTGCSNYSTRLISRFGTETKVTHVKIQSLPLLPGQKKNGNDKRE